MVARAELRSATITCHADRYNEIVEQQRALKALLSEAMDTIVETLKVKEGLAKQQHTILHSDMGPLHYLYPEQDLRSLADVRRDYLDEITKRLEDHTYNPNCFSMDKLDLTCRLMHPGGNLE